MTMNELEDERKWLIDKKLCIEELLAYLTKINDGVMVYVKKITINTTNCKIFEMSNGISYLKNINGFWEIL